MRPFGMRPFGMRPFGMRPFGMRPFGMRPPLRHCASDTAAYARLCRP